MAERRPGDYAHRAKGGRPPDEAPRPKPIGSSPGAALKAAGPYLNVGIQVGLTMAMMAGLGYLVDDWLGTSPWGILLGSLFGVIAVFAVLFRLVDDLNKQSAQRHGGRLGEASLDDSIGAKSGSESGG